MTSRYKDKSEYAYLLHALVREHDELKRDPVRPKPRKTPERLDPRPHTEVERWIRRVESFGRKVDVLREEVLPDDKEVAEHTKYAWDLLGTANLWKTEGAFSEFHLVLCAIGRACKVRLRFDETIE